MPEGGWGDMKTAGCSTDIEAEAIDLATLEPHDEETVLASVQLAREEVEEAEEGALDALGTAVGEAIGDLSAADRRDDDAVREAARLAIRRSLKASYGKRPVTDIHIVRI